MLLADLTASGRPSDRPEEFIADPELKQAPGHQDIAGAAAVVLAHAAVETLDLARRGRRAGLGEDVVNAVLPADAVEQHFDRRLSKAPSEHHAVVRQDLRRYSIFAQR